MEYSRALLTAKALIEYFGPFCYRIESAGSLRRLISLFEATGKIPKREVGDLELVAIPRFKERTTGGQTSLFGPPPTETVNLVWEAIDAEPERLKPISPAASAKGIEEPERDALWHTKRLHTAGHFKFWLLRKRLSVDLYLVTPETWGYNFTTKTGSADFSKALVTRWGKEFKGTFESARFVREGSKLPTPEEEDVFRLLRLAWVPPHERHGWRTVEDAA